MSPLRLSRSADLQRLRDDGYDIDVVAGYLVISHVPFADQDGNVGYGRLISVLSLNADVTVRPGDHVAYFQGGTPCDTSRAPLAKVINSSGSFALAPGLQAEHLLSSKPADGYRDYHHKMSTYISIISAQAQAIDASATAMTFPVVENTDDASVFRYADSASSRAGIAAVSARLAVGKVAIVGLGGTGSYVLDLLAKTPVDEIHMFDKDLFLQHNAFRSPGPPPSTSSARASQRSSTSGAGTTRSAAGSSPTPTTSTPATSTNSATWRSSSSRWKAAR